MARFEVVRHTGQSAVESWNRLTDWERHGDFIPFTKVLVTPARSGEPAPAEGLVARTSLGPMHFDDPMDVTYWQPPDGSSPGICRIVKRGTVVTGWAVLTVTPTTTGASIHWKEDATVRFTGKLLGWPTKVIGSRVFGRLVDGLLAS